MPRKPRKTKAKPGSDLVTIRYTPTVWVVDRDTLPIYYPAQRRLPLRHYRGVFVGARGLADGSPIWVVVLELRHRAPRSGAFSLFSAATAVNETDFDQFVNHAVIPSRVDDAIVDYLQQWAPRPGVSRVGFDGLPRELHMIKDPIAYEEAVATYLAAV